MKKYLTIIVEEHITRTCSLEIGKDISTEDANDLLLDEDEYNTISKGYSDIASYLDDDYSDSKGFENVQIYVE